MMNTSSNSSSNMTMNSVQSNLFNHQINAYKYLVRNQTIPEQHLIAIKRSQQQQPPQQQQQQFYPPNAVITKQTSSPTIETRYNPPKLPINGSNPRYSTPSTYYSPIQINGTATTNIALQNSTNIISQTPSITDNVLTNVSNVALPQANTTIIPATNTTSSSSRTNNNLRLTPVQKPTGVDVQEVLVERDLRIEHNIVVRITELEKLLPTLMQDDLRMRAMIELKALRLLTFQKQVRDFLVSFFNIIMSFLVLVAH